MDLISLAMGLAQFAPWVVKLITGSDKAEQAAGKVVEIAQAVTGKSSGSDALAAIQGDPSLVLKFRETVGAQQGDLEKAFLADVQDARHRDTEIRKQTGGKNSRADLMIVGDLVGLVACMVILIFLRKTSQERSPVF